MAIFTVPVVLQGVQDLQGVVVARVAVSVNMQRLVPMVVTVVTLYILQVGVLSLITVTFTAAVAVEVVQVVRMALVAVAVVGRTVVRVHFVQVSMEAINVFTMVNIQAVPGELVKDMGNPPVEELVEEPVVLMV
jgi:hypothetical protein